MFMNSNRRQLRKQEYNLPGCECEPNRYLAGASAWSYSLYLVHVQGMELFGWLRLPNLCYLLTWFGVMLTSLGFAYVFYRLMERPSHQLARKIRAYGARPVALTEEPALKSPRRCIRAVHSVMMRSAHSTRPTKTAGFPNLKPHCVTSASVTPRARLHAPQAKTGMCLAMIFSKVSLSGGQPTGMIALTVAFRIK
jgi:hypothetical protein